MSATTMIKPVSDGVTDGYRGELRAMLDAGIAALTTAQRARSRAPTFLELHAAVVEAVNRTDGCTIAEDDGPDPRGIEMMVTSSDAWLAVTTATRPDRSVFFYFEGRDFDLLRAIAEQIAAVAGPQVILGDSEVCEVIGGE